MKKIGINRYGFRAGLAIGLAFGLTALASEFGSRAEVDRFSLTNRSSSAPDGRMTSGVENYDIRLDKGNDAARTLSAIRATVNRSPASVTRIRQEQREGEATLRRRVAGLTLEYSPALGVPEVIGVDANQRQLLTEPSGTGPDQKHAALVRSFLAANKGLFGLSQVQIDRLVVRADYTNPNGILSFVDLGQEINGISVFQGEIRTVITANGAIARLINNLAPGLDERALPTARGRAEDAVFAAARAIHRRPTNADIQLRSTANAGRLVTFAAGQFADPIRAELIYFPTEPGVATLAWQVSLWEPVNSYYVIVDAATGKLLWRKNTTSDQSQSATYNIYNDDSPGPLSPSTAFPGSGIQGPGIARTTITLIGNEAPNPGMNNLGWITDGTNITDGNNVEAGPDLVAPNGVDAPITGNPNRVFNFSYNPPPLGSDDPATTSYRNGDSTNLFYWTNIFHDRLYAAGFTEPARNFQHDNFGRGGVGGDRVSAETQDLGNSLSAQADGIRPHLQVSLFNQTTPSRDGALEGAVFLHELTHGLSGRLIGNGAGLSSNRAGSLGEGWSDFLGLLLVSTPSDDVNGIYPFAPYVSLNLSTLGTNNYYYGLRRFPVAAKSALGGPLNRPHNPLTFADIDQTQINVNDGAYPAMVGAHISTTASQVHNAGEVWCAMLFEVRARLITRLGFAVGNQRMLQLVTDGMKLSPLNPNFINARDAILAADQAGFGGADLNDIWDGFATRGAGVGAVDGNQSVTESFVVPSRARADFDGDGTSDVSVVRNGSTWFLLQSRDGFAGIQFGAPGDKPVPGDYDGDGKTDEAVFRGGTTWYLLRSSAGFTGIAFGAQGDLPVSADYDGDRKTDIAVYRPSTGVWYVLCSSDNVVQTYFWGQAGDKPLRGDFDGDGRSDPTVFRGGNWFVLKSTGGTSAVHWGQQGDKPVPADYDGDRITDHAVYRGGVWYILASATNSVIAQSWGLENDLAVPADYDGDGRDDVAVFRSGVWYILGSASGRLAQPEAIKVIQFGAAGDDPGPAGYVPEQ